MINYGEKTFVIDIEAISDYIDLSKKEDRLIEKTIETVSDLNDNTRTTIKETFGGKIKEIDSTKYNLIYDLLHIVLDDTLNEDDDSALGADRALESKSLSFKIAFNTLLQYNIIKEI